MANHKRKRRRNKKENIEFGRKRNNDWDWILEGMVAKEKQAKEIARKEIEKAIRRVG